MKIAAIFISSTAVLLVMIVAMPQIPKNLLGAAIGTIDVSLLKFWQNAGGFNTTRTSGGSGSDIAAIQKALATDPQVNFIATPNGYFGDSTEVAIRNFQAEYRLDITGVIDQATLTQLNVIFFNQLCPAQTSVQPDLSLAHVTKLIGLPPEYVPANLVNITPLVRTIGVQCLSRDAAQALQLMFAAASQEGIEFAVSSGYRRPDIQKLTHDFWIAVEGENVASKDSALPYHSEHQTGTAVDLAGASSGYQSVSSNFGNSSEGKWLEAHAWEYGFNQSYPDKNDGEYVYEPWHWRFVGVPLATELHRLHLSYGNYPAGSTNRGAVASSAAQAPTKAPIAEMDPTMRLLLTQGSLF